MLISFAMICSCQKQGSAAERQLAQRKAELDAREKALDEREKELALRETVLKERERGLAKNEKAAGNARTIQDPAQVQAEKDRIRQQLPAQWDADRDKRIQQLPPRFGCCLKRKSNSPKKEGVAREPKVQCLPQNN